MFTLSDKEKYFIFYVTFSDMFINFHVKWGLVTTAWCVLGLRMDEMASGYGGYL
jgi:hypothetical protein